MLRSISNVAAGFSLRAIPQAKACGYNAKNSGTLNTLLFSSQGDIHMAEQMDRELKNALQQIEKQFGKGSIMQLGESTAMDVQGISTGALSLDIALGGKGL